MNYVFFDIECANCLNGEGKICSFGYVLTDEHFHVLKKKDILINPAAEFLLGNARTGEGIKLAYPLFKFERQHTFPYYYREIKALLENENNLSFGFAVNQDVSYLCYSCKRYGLPLIEFTFFDIQNFEKQINKRKNASGLDTLIKEYQLPVFTYHRSDDDALMSMEVFQKILLEHNLTLEDVLKQYGSILNHTEKFFKEITYKKKQKFIKSQHIEKIKQLFDGPHTKPDINLYIPSLYKKEVYIEYGLLYEEIDYFITHKKSLEAHGLLFTKSASAASIILIHGKQKTTNLPNLKANVQYMTFSNLKNLIEKKGQGYDTNRK